MISFHKLDMWIEVDIESNNGYSLDKESNDGYSRWVDLCTSMQLMEANPEHRA